MTFNSAKPMLSLAAAILLSLSVSLAPCRANDTAQLRSAVSKMNQWLGDGSRAQGWRKYLNLNVLDSQAALGDQADSQTLRELLSRFRKDAAGLKHPMFQEVARSIENQIATLDAIQSTNLGDLQAIAGGALSQFRPPTTNEIDNARKVAIYELQMLQAFYRRSLYSRERAEIFHELQLDQTVDFLEKLEIEMPPEVSVGKIRSMIRDQKAKRQEIQDKLDALPLDDSPEPDDGDDDDGPEPDLQLEPPGPDDGSDDDREMMEQQVEVFDKRIEELEAKRKSIQDEDESRQEARDDIRREMLRAKSRFRRVAKDRTDGVFAAARKAIDKFADDYRFGTEDNIQEDFIRQVVELRELLPSLNDPADSASHAKLGTLVHWLENHQQLGQLTKSIRRQFSGPNGYVSVSQSLIQSLTSRTQREYDRVAEDFLGRFARGLSYTDASVNVTPLTSPYQAHLRINLNGTASTNTYVRELGIRVNSSASGYLAAQRDLYAGLNGLTGTGSSIDANLQAAYGGANTRFGLIQRIVQKQFAEQLPRTNAEATRRARSSLSERFDTETSTAIADAQDQLGTLSAQLRSIAGRLPEMFLRSTHDRVEVVAKKDSRLGLSAVNQPIEQIAGRDIQLKLHESMLNNFLDELFAGRRLTNRQLNDEISALAGQEVVAFPTEDKDGEPVPPFRIRFARSRPIQLTFANNEIGVKITGTEFQQGKDKIEDKLIIQWSLRIVQSDGGLVLQPQGYPEIDLPEDEDPSARSIASATVFRKRLKELVDEEKKESNLDIKLPPQLIPDLKEIRNIPIASQLQLGLLEMRDGWAYLGWNLGGGVMNTPGIWTQMTVESLDSSYTPAEPTETLELLP